ncbi:DMT family transporter [Undibacterium sp. Jales W-56]|uniref:DMT family transporter n=1 Tax=Undibacterium sp. Jales W-56 TaxID=2897325 RepID=UPI0021CFE136|nr:DMT family transporter [Undibacterium sp. Jales W-56]MCU6434607.1 DMT family transporter [Undibacterium sp. Jales W-56]
MISTRKNLDGFAVAIMVLLCLCWGLQQVAIKIAAPVLSSSMQLGLRSAIAALLVMAVILVRRIPFSLRDGSLLPGIAAGVLFAVEFVCISIGLNYTSASHMSVFLYTAPIFTVMGLHWLIPAERMQASQWLGIVSAFLGVAIAFSAAFQSDAHALGEMLIGDALGILGGILWAATTVVIRRSKLSEAQPTTTLLYQLAGAAVLLLLFSGVKGEFHLQAWDARIWINLFFQSVVIAFASYLTWFWLLRRYLASRLSVFSFLTPLFGVAAGVLFLHDPISPRFVIGATLVLAGIVLVNFRRN